MFVVVLAMRLTRATSKADYTVDVFINPFFPNAPFLYPLKTSKNLTVFWYFQGVEKGCIGNEWVNFCITLPLFSYNLE